MGIEKLLDLLIEFVDLFRFWEVINQFERGVVLQLGKFRREVGPGIQLICPFAIDKVLTDNVTFKTGRLRAQTLTTKDRKTIVVSPVVAYKIKHIKKFLLEVEGAEDALEDMTYGTVGTLVRKTRFDEMMSDEWHDTLFEQVRKEGFKFGIEVEAVRLSDFGDILTIRLINSDDSEAIEDDNE